MSIKKLKENFVLVIIVALLAFIGLYIFSPIGTGQGDLNKAQRESLCKQFEKADLSHIDEIPGLMQTNASAIKIFGVDREGDTADVYGYVSSGTYIKIKDKAYEESGGLYEFKIKIAYDGDDVKIIKRYGDGVSTESTLAEYTLRYKLKYNIYYWCNFYRNLEEKANKKASKVLGVPVDDDNVLSIEGEDYEIFDFNENNEVVYLDKGKISDLIE